MKLYRELAESRSAVDRFRPEVNNTLTFCHRTSASTRVLIRITAVGAEWLEGQVLSITGKLSDLKEGDEIAFPHACAFRLWNYLEHRHAFGQAA